jgi:hypothetical protein
MKEESMSQPLVLNLYDEDSEITKTCSRSFVPWKMLKKAVKLYKLLGKKGIDEYEETDIDALTSYIIEVFPGQDLTVEILDEQAAIPEMMNVIKTIMSNARGVMDPTLPSKKA